MTLVDTSVWIDFFAGSNKDHVKILENLIDANEDIAICGLVLTEVLQGISNNKEHQKVKDYFNPIIRLDIQEDIWLFAADIYRYLRKKGITIRKTNDCVIAATAIFHNVCLLHNDKHFDEIGRYFSLQTD